MYLVSLVHLFDCTKKGVWFVYENNNAELTHSIWILFY